MLAPPLRAPTNPSTKKTQTHTTTTCPGGRAQRGTPRKKPAKGCSWEAERSEAVPSAARQLGGWRLLDPSPGPWPLNLLYKKNFVRLFVCLCVCLFKALLKKWDSLLRKLFQNEKRTVSKVSKKFGRSGEGKKRERSELPAYHGRAQRAAKTSVASLRLSISTLRSSGAVRTCPLV